MAGDVLPSASNWHQVFRYLLLLCKLCSEQVIECTKKDVTGNCVLIFMITTLIINSCCCWISRMCVHLIGCRTLNEVSPSRLEITSNLLTHFGPVMFYGGIDLGQCSDYLNQCWIFICDVLWHLSESDFTAHAHAIVLYNAFEYYTFIFFYCRISQGTMTYPNTRWMICLHFTALLCCVLCRDLLDRVIASAKISDDSTTIGIFIILLYHNIFIFISFFYFYFYIYNIVISFP